MVRAFWVSWCGWLLFGFRLLRAAGVEGAACVPRRVCTGLLAWIAFGLLNGLHWAGFLLDELLFRGYRDVAVSRPLFIVGMPRSGTTFLHRVLARDSRFTALTTLESVLAPSITERYVWFAAARLLRPLRGVLGLKRLRERFDPIHRIRLHEPEEDFLLLLPLQACFLGVILCPDDEHYWKLARFDQAVDRRYADTVGAFYKRCLQRHLYFHGAGRVLLSKNPSFTPMLGTLRRLFPDARFVACVRRPGEVVPSQLSALLPAFQLLGSERLPPGFHARMVDVLHEYLDRLASLAERGAVVVVEMHSLNDALDTVVERILKETGHPPTTSFNKELAALSAASKRHHSRHRYALADFGLHEPEVERKFAVSWKRVAPYALSAQG